MPLNEFTEFLSMTAVAFWLAYVCGVCTAVMYPIVGVALYILVYHLNPEYQWWGSTVRVVGLRTSLTVAAATMLGIWLRWPRFEGRARQFSFPIVILGVLVLYGIASLFWGAGMHWRGTHHADKAVKVFIFVLILIRCVRLPQHYHLVIGSWLLGVLYIGYQASGDVGAMRGGRLSHGIGGPDFAESSDLSVHLVATLPLIGAFFFMSRTWIGRTFALVTGALAVNTIVLTRTRNALLGIIAMAVVAALSLPKGYRLKGWGAIILGGALAMQLADPAWWDRMALILHYEQDVAVTARFDYWHAALQMALDYPLGIGMGNFHHMVIEYVPWLTYERGAHSTYMACLAELGFPGLILLFLALFGTLTRLGSVRKAAAQLPTILPIGVGPFQWRFHLGWHAMALRAGLVGYATCSIFTTRLWAEDFWILLGLAACLWNVTEHMKVVTGKQRSPAHALERVPEPESECHGPIAHPLPNPTAALLDEPWSEHLARRAESSDPRSKET